MSRDPSTHGTYGCVVWQVPGSRRDVYDPQRWICFCCLSFLPFVWQVAMPM